MNQNTTTTHIYFVVYSCRSNYKKACILYDLIADRFPHDLIPCICVGNNTGKNTTVLPHLFGNRRYIHVPCGDKYEHLTAKTWWLLRAIHMLTANTNRLIGMIKCDDDILPSVYNITELLNAIRRTDNGQDPTRLYLGKRTNIPVPYYSSHHIGKCSTLAFNKRILVPSGIYMTGPLYYLGIELIQWIVTKYPKSLPHFYEDISIGMAVNHYLSENNPVVESPENVVVKYSTEVSTDQAPTFYQNIHNINNQRKYLFIDLQGGIGNQLFQVASAYGIAKRHDLYLVLVYYPGEISTIYQHNVSEREFLDTILSQFPIISSTQLKTVYTNDNDANNPVFIYEPSHPINNAFKYNPNIIGSRSKSYYLRGYFQNIQYIQPYIPEIVDLFVKGIGPTLVQSIQSRYLPTLANSFFVHIRRGDYLNHLDLHVPLDDYYVDAIGRFSEKSVNDKPEHMYVISNDPLFCETYAPLNVWPGPRTILPQSEITTLETLVFMALCLYGGVCANSTFSWWGGFLGVNSKMVDTSETTARQMYLPSQWILSDTAKQIDMSYSGATLL